MMSSGINLVMTVIGFAVSTMFIVFVCTRLVCARIHLNSSRGSFHIASRSDLSVLERGLHGLEQVVIAHFPTKKYSDEFFSAAENTQCSICLGEYHNEDVLRILPYCGHFFHVKCIDIWLQQHSTCPVCRISLREFSDRKQLMQLPLYSSPMRSEHDAEIFDSHPYNYMLTGSTFSPDTRNQNHGINPALEVHCASPCNREETRQDMDSVDDHEISNVKDSAKKHAESPSDNR